MHSSQTVINQNQAEVLARRNAMRIANVKRRIRNLFLQAAVFIVVVGGYKPGPTDLYGAA